MGKELPIVPSPSPSPEGDEAAHKEAYLYCRVFCSRENSPPLRLLLDYLKAKGQIPFVPKMDPEALDDWAWVRLSIGYNRERNPIQVFCVRDRGTYRDLLEDERQDFLNRLAVFDDEEAQLAREFVTRARFIVTTQLTKADITDEGYDFNSWILEFFQDNCNGVVQIDGQGFFSPKGELIVSMEEITDQIDTV